MMIPFLDLHRILMFIRVLATTGWVKSHEGVAIFNEYSEILQSKPTINSSNFTSKSLPLRR